jgi:Co/Zn/Cd efflux system component
LPRVQQVRDLHIWGINYVRNSFDYTFDKMPEVGLSDEEHLKINQVLAKEFHIEHVIFQVEQGKNILVSSL